MLPESEDKPALSAKERGYLAVALDVAPDLLSPKGAIRFGCSPVLRACVPETTVDKHNDPAYSECQIRPTDKAAAETVTKAERPQRRPKSQLWTGIAAPDPRHASTALFRAEYVGHRKGGYARAGITPTQRFSPRWRSCSRRRRCPEESAATSTNLGRRAAVRHSVLLRLARAAVCRRAAGGRSDAVGSVSTRAAPPPVRAIGSRVQRTSHLPFRALRVSGTQRSLYTRRDFPTSAPKNANACSDAKARSVYPSTLMRATHPTGPRSGLRKPRAASREGMHSCAPERRVAPELLRPGRGDRLGLELNRRRRKVAQRIRPAFQARPRFGEDMILVTKDHDFLRTTKSGLIGDMKRVADRGRRLGAGRWTVSEHQKSFGSPARAYVG